MPKNRRHIDKDEKKQQVIEAAQTLFLTEGYHNTSMARLAKAAGIAPNTIYWYFKNKDAVFAEVVNSIVHEHFQEYQARAGYSLEDNLHWALEKLTAYRPLATPLHELMDKSEEIRQVHDNFHRIARAAGVHAVMQEGMNQDDAENLVAIWEHVLEGLLLHSATEEERTRICDFLFAVSRKVISEGLD